MVNDHEFVVELSGDSSTVCLDVALLLELACLVVLYFCDV